MNNLPQLTAQITLSAGDTFYTDNHTPGGYILMGHSTNATSRAKMVRAHGTSKVVFTFEYQPLNSRKENHYWSICDVLGREINQEQITCEHAPVICSIDM